MRVRLIPDAVDGVNLGGHDVGDVIDVSERDGRLLLAERWAEPADIAPVPSQAAGEGARQSTASSDVIADAADSGTNGKPKTIAELRVAREALERHARMQQEQRRAEDQFREELRDSRAKTVERD